ncbi:dihydroxyacetone kinase subunit DhaK [Acetomicrobium hydrogeniformans]|uniref:dihydroxyacetone kinase subunit DhaK n=1 Tax=Acetomicrobium hydrogeniformans TaxID=649746 RepID=UPI0023549066|nr:dihydroxyacetone kinase subunit DhaK [Acetomicrobium hydrogeniformans]
MKKLINEVEKVVEESLQGLVKAHADLVKLHPSVRAVLRVDSPKEKVAVISGGGSGHEPMHTGFVGFGMLDAACPGEIFTSPTPDQMYEAAKTVNGGKGVLYIVKNYSGDIMNFQMAADMLAGEGIPVEQVIINDDVAVEDSLYTAGRRGVGGDGFGREDCWRKSRGRCFSGRSEKVVRKSQCQCAFHGNGFDIVYSSCCGQANI